MSEILIRGMEMPQCGERHIVIRADGSVHDDGDSEIHWSAFQPTAKAVELPPHGDLIDRDALLAEYERDERAADEHGREFSFSFDSGGTRCTEWWIVQQKLMDAPVVIPSNKEKHTDA